MHAAQIQYDGYIFDLDGTVYRGDRLIDGAKEKVQALRARGARMVFLSNKPVEPRANYAAKLTRLGIPTATEDVINSTQAMFHRLRKVNTVSGLFVIGEPALIREFGDEGFSLTENLAEITTVIAALDRTLTYAKLNLAHQALVRGAAFLATNPDKTCPMDGMDIPDCAGVIAFLEATTGRTIEFIAGKPAPGILEAALSRLGVSREHCLMVGDRLATDMQMGITYGLDTALVLTGVTGRDELNKSSLKPTYVLNSIADVL